MRFMSVNILLFEIFKELIYLWTNDASLKSNKFLVFDKDIILIHF